MRRLLLFVLGLALLAVAYHLISGRWTADKPSSAHAGPLATTIVDSPPLATGDAPARLAALEIGEYRADTAGLPPGDAPLSSQVPALESAAALGNPTAACRLALIGLQCLSVAHIPDSADYAAESWRQEEERVARAHPEGVLDRILEQYRDYARTRVDAETLNSLEGMERQRRWRVDCGPAPPVSAEKTMTYLRQAALAGEARSMASYAHGDWMVVMIGAAGARSLVEAHGPGMAWSRSRAFDDWRSEAAAVRRAGLERGDPEMLRRELDPAHDSVIDQLVWRTPTERAAALRAFAALLGGHQPESTSALGLPPQDAVHADQLADRWASRARERGRSVAASNDPMLSGNGVPTCE